MQGNFVTYGIYNVQVQKYVVIFGSMDWSHCSTIQSEPWPTSLNRAPVLTQFSERWVSPHKHLSFPFRAVLRSEVLPRDRDMRQGAERRAGEYKTIWDVNKRILYSYNFDKNERACSYVDEPFCSLWRLESNEEKRYLTGLFHALNGGLWPFCVGGWRSADTTFCCWHKSKAEIMEKVL